jgi:hypothetical protein
MPARGLSQGGCWRRNAALQSAWRGQAMQGGGLHQVVCRRYGALQGAWRRQAMPACGLPQECCERRHAALHCPWRRHPLQGGGLYQVSSRQLGVLHRTWRRKAMPAHGLPHGSCKWGYAALHGAWRRQALSERTLLPTCRSREFVLHAMSTGLVDRRLAAGTWQRQAMPARGLPKGCRKSWHTTLRRTWRRQAMPARGLLHGCCKWRYAALHSAWRRQALSESALLSTSLSREFVLRAMSTGLVDWNHAAGPTTTAWRGCASSHDTLRPAGTMLPGGRAVRGPGVLVAT